jgi:hypothetical protein
MLEEKVVSSIKGFSSQADELLSSHARVGLLVLPLPLPSF